jgi:hypothetical protein
MAEPTEQNKASGRFGVRELIEEAQREAFMRRRVYPNQVRSGRMSQQDADRRIDLMEAIVTRLSRTAGVE